MSISDDTRLTRWRSKVRETATCWMWDAGCTEAGYGQFRWSTATRTTAHRAGYRMLVGPIPDGYEIDHLCRVRRCVNPAHLEAVTRATNSRRAHHATGTDLPNGRKTHCPAGHAYADANLAMRPDGARACRACRRAASQRFEAKRRSH